MYIWDDVDTEFTDEEFIKAEIKKKIAALLRLINWINLFGSQA